MSSNKQPQGQPGENALLKRIGYRKLAISIMLVGAAGFVVALLAFEEQVFCLLVSTLVTLIGLGVNITARRLGLEPDRFQSFDAGARVETRERGRTPPALKSKRGRLTQSVSAPVLRGEPLNPEAFQERRQVQEEASLDLNIIVPGSLADRVLIVLESQGARLASVNCRERRYIMKAVLEDETIITAMVFEGEEPASVSDARALLSMVTRDSSGKGFLISQPQFSREMIMWAADRTLIKLVNDENLDQIII